jgi:hypothetical protein
MLLLFVVDPVFVLLGGNMLINTRASEIHINLVTVLPTT